MSILGGDDGERLRRDAERARDLEEGYLFEPRSASGGRSIAPDGAQGWRELADTWLGIAYDGYLLVRDLHFALYWAALAGPSPRAPLGTAEAQRGHDRTDWEDIVLDVSARDLRRLLVIVVPAVAALSAVIAASVGIGTGDERITAVSIVTSVAGFGVMWLQAQRFAQRARDRLDAAEWRSGR